MWTFAAAAAVALAGLACSAGQKDTQGPGAQGSASGATSTAGGPKHTIKLEVVGPASASVTYGLGGDQSQENDAKLPWTKDLTSNESFLIVSVVAQSKGTGDITCRITVDGKVVKENKSSGQYAVVTCTS